MKPHFKSNAAEIKQILTIILMKLITFSCQFLTVPLLIGALTKSEYALWIIITNLTIWIGMLDLGIHNTLRNEISKERQHNSHQKIGELIGTGYQITFIASLFLFFGFWIISPYIDWVIVFGIDAIEKTNLSHLLLTVLGLFALRTTMQTIFSLFYGYERPEVPNYATGLASILTLVALAYLRYSGERELIIYAITISGLPIIILAILSLYVFLYRAPHFRPQLRIPPISTISRLAYNGNKFLLMQLSSLVVFSSSSVIIAHTLNETAVIEYNTAYLYFSVPIIGYSILSTTLWGFVSSAYFSGNLTAIRVRLRIMNLISLCFCIFTAMQFLLIDHVTDLWLGDDFNISTKLSFSLMILSISTIILSPYTTILNAIGQLKTGIIHSLISLFIYIPMAVYFAKTFQHSFGVVLATILLSLLGLIIQPAHVYLLLKEKGGNSDVE